MSTDILIVLGIVAFVLIALVGLYVTKYRTAGPDEALIVTGSYLGSKMYIRMSREIVLKSFVGRYICIPYFPTSTAVKLTF